MAKLDKPQINDQLGAVCHCCERKLKIGAKVILVLMDTDATHYDSDVSDIPEQQNLGWHTFGLTCARKLKLFDSYAEAMDQ